MIKYAVSELREIVNDFSQKLSAMDNGEFSDKPLLHKWSKKEVLGHLIDSAQNNLRRFVCSQYELAPPKILYNQDFWVVANDYQRMDKDEIIMLWALLNKRIAVILETMPVENHKKQAETSGLFTIEWLAADYVKHLKHHLNQIIFKSFDVVYP